MNKTILLAIAFVVSTTAAHAKPGDVVATVNLLSQTTPVTNARYSIDLLDMLKNCPESPEKLCGIARDEYCGCDAEIRMPTSAPLKMVYKGSCKATELEQDPKKTVLRLTLVGGDCRGCRVTVWSGVKNRTIIDLNNGTHTADSNCNVRGGGGHQDTPGGYQDAPGGYQDTPAQQ